METAALHERYTRERRTAIIVDPEPGAPPFTMEIAEWLGAEVVAETSSYSVVPALLDLHHPDLLVLPCSDVAPCARLADDPRLTQAGTQLVVIGDGAADSTVYRRLLEGGALVILTPAARNVLENGTRLTRREREICALLAQGLSNRQIARQLWVTERTIKFHLGNIYKKLGVARRTDAVETLQRLARVG